MNTMNIKYDAHGYIITKTAQKFNDRAAADADMFAPWLLEDGTAVWVEGTRGLEMGHVVYRTDFHMHAAGGGYKVALPNNSRQGYILLSYGREDIIPAGKAG